MALKIGDMETSFEIRTFDSNLSIEQYGALPKSPLYVILDNLRSAFNVGAIFRLCDTMRVSGLFLCGYTAYPPHEKLFKTSMGTIDYVPWKHFDTTSEAVEYCRNLGIPVWAAETTSHSKPFFSVEIAGPVAIVFGNEALGVAPDVLERCDSIIEIPVFGFKNSLNVATACSVIGYSILERTGFFNQATTRSSDIQCTD